MARISFTLGPASNLIGYNIYLYFSDSTGFLSYIKGVPAIVGLTIGLSILSFLLCFLFRLFARGQYPRSRGYGDANIPPTITLEGTNILKVCVRGFM